MEPFDGINVLDFTQSVAGPLATQLLGTLGANVVKVEPPGGDTFRPLLDGSMFAAMNLGGKRSVALDLTTDEGRKAGRDLAERADVVIESFRPGTLERFDLDYESVREHNEDVVYCSLTGFGQSGPYSQRPAYDPVIQAMSGLMSTIGYSDRLPVRIGASVIDCGTGTYAAFLVSAALLDRSAGGGGEYIDVNLYEVAVSWMGYWIANYVETGDVPEPTDRGFAGLAPNGTFEASDGPFYMAVVNDEFWERLCDAINRDDLLTDERFVTNELRWEHREELKEELEATFANWSREELTATLAERGVPAGPQLDVHELVEDDPHLAARDLLTTTHNVETDTETMTAFPPFTTSAGRPDPGTRPPQVGEHTRAVLAELGYDEDQIDAMIAAGAAHETDG